MTKILAISGGVDSMVMLDALYCLEGGHDQLATTNELFIAHYNHGTRPSSADDSFFVARAAAERYRLPYFCGSYELGENVSEALARTYRYDFLRYVAFEQMSPQTVYLSAIKPGRPKIGREIPVPKIYTAHHLDDLVESVAINLLRGTGWRGLTVMDAPGIVRPFLEPEILGGTKPWSKKDILRYAAAYKITFRQDPTNCEDKYLRNRVRKKLSGFDQAMQIYQLWQRQKQLKREVDQLVNELLPPYGEPWQRGWFQDLDQNIALELLRAGTLRAGISATRPQLENFRQAILHYAPGTYFNLPGDKLIKLSKISFIL